MTLETNRVRELLATIAHHQQQCASLLHRPSHRALARAAQRFLKIESVMLTKMATLFAEQGVQRLGLDPAQAHSMIEVGEAEANDFAAMHEVNQQLIDEIKRCLNRIDDKSLTVLVSYWLAALQVENDEMAKYLPVEA